MRSVVVIVTAMIVMWTDVVRADGPWDGLWYRDDTKSHYADHSFTLEKKSNGKWTYTSGDETFVFAADGKPYPEVNAPDLSLRASASGENVLEATEAVFGRDVARVRYAAAPDGKTLSLKSTRVYPDGHEMSSESVAIRISEGAGLDGTWKERAENAQPGAGATVATRPYWVISTSADGVMSWFIPATGELIRGKPDGQPRPLTGPQQPGGRTFVWKQVSPRRIDFFASDNGHVIETAIETLSEDGKTFTDTLWVAGHEDEKDVRVFEKRR
ncbi:MAG TPA: hypothetical protein VH814_02710 [Steroidobacteraceae bacterium]